MLTFDLAELRKDGVDVGPLPDERGHMIDAATLPPAWLRRHGFDRSKPLRIVGVISRGPRGSLGPYTIGFDQP